MKSTLITIIQTLILPFAISFMLTPIVIRLSKRFNIMDIPNERKIHELPTPIGGGIGIYIAFLVFFILFPPERAMSGVLAGSSIIFLVGLINDIKGMSAFKRLMAHILASMILIASGVSVIIFKNEGIGFLLNSLITILWVVGITNAMNFFDGMDGLAPGLSIIYSFFLGIVFLQNQNIFMFLASLALIGSTLGFLPYNFKIKGNAEIFLGDSGSNLLGFVLASFAVIGEWSERKLIDSIMAPILIFAVLIYDMVYINVSRLLEGRVKGFKALLEYTGKDHLHHRLYVLLSDKPKTVFFIYLFSISLGIGALVLKDIPDPYSLLLLLQAFLIIMLVAILEIAENRILKGKHRVEK